MRANHSEKVGGRHQLRVRSAALLVIAASAIMFPPAALAAETVINLDDQPAHTTIASQYAAQGITFDERPSGPAELHPFTETPPAGQAHSSPNVLNVSLGCGGEFPHAELWGRFASPRNHVSMFVGNVYPELVAETQEVKLQGFDLGGNPIPGATDTVSFKGLGVETEASIHNAESEISFFQISSNLNTFCPVAIDDLSFEALPSTIPPDFGLSAQGSGVTLTPGSSSNVTLNLHRTSTSTGPISFSVSGLPSGVSSEIKPNPTSGPDGSSLTLTLAASSNAPAEVYPGAKVTVTGTPSPTAGEKQRSITIPVYLSGSFDLRAQGLEVTQGIQPEAARLTPSGAESGGNYSGVNLVAHKQTAVRLFADVNGGHRVGGVPNVGAILYGYREGRQLPGSPVYPDFGPATLEDTGEATVSESERDSEANAFTFTLPQSWTESGAVQLVGHVFQEPSFPSSQQQVECSAPSCLADNSFTENGINFQSTQNVMLWPVALSVNGHLPVPSSVAFADPKLVTPLADPGWNPRNPNDGFTVLPYQAIIDISDIVNSTDKGLNKTNAAQSRVEELASDMGHPDFGAFGIAPEGIGGVNFNYFGGTSVTAYNPSRSEENRPLTAVAHELFHMFGQKHASSECGGGDDGDSDDTGQEGVSWPLRPGDSHDSVKATVGETSPDSGSPDQEGFGQLLGIGLDMSSEPYTIRADGVNGTTEYYDFMSYCSPMRGGGDQGNFGNWVSPINWEAVFHNFDKFARFSSSGSSQVAPRAALARTSAATANRRGSRTADAALNPGRLRVIGFGDDAGFQLTSVGPRIGPPLPSGKSSYTLTARGKQGQVIATAPMAESIGHEDAGQLYELSAEIPARRVYSIEVSSKGAVIASRTRPRRPPHVRILAPHPGSRVGGTRKILVSWRATNPDHQALTTSVDYSRTNGRTWQTVFIGPNTGHASLPGSYLEGSGAARVRVRVNDGFNESVAVSHRITVLDAPPQVTIAKTLARIPGDARLQLQGQAFDQRPGALGGRSLRWFDGPFALGSGATISAGPLPPGKNHIRLIARDVGGTAMARALVTVKPVHLAFLRLKIPKSVPRSARKLVFHARSAVHAVLTVDKLKFNLGPKTKRLSLPIKSGSSLLLHLAVKADGVTTPFAAAIRPR
jgi:hypothetical protein